MDNLDDTVRKVLSKSKRPMVVREIYVECMKVCQWNHRSIRRAIENNVTVGFVTALKCPCGHSHMYWMTTLIGKNGYTFKYTVKKD